MKSWHWIVLVCGLLCMASPITVEANHVKIAKSEKQEKTVPEEVVLKCPKCQNGMDQGFLLDIQGSADNERGATSWVQGAVQKSFWKGVKVSLQRPVTAFRCINCGYIELYAQ
jgi:predicted nucleic-acid-binding Zn-ribbon protein